MPLSAEVFGGHINDEPEVIYAIRKNAELPPRLLRTQEAARFLGISLRTLEKHRTYGTDPTYRKIGGCVLYAVRDKDAGTVFPAGPLTPDERSKL